MTSACTFCGEFLLFGGGTLHDRLGDQPRHICPPRWEALIGDAIKSLAWADLARSAYARSAYEAAGRIIKEWNENDGDYPLGPSRSGRSLSIEILVRRADTPTEQARFIVTAEPDIHYDVQELQTTGAAR